MEEGEGDFKILTKKPTWNRPLGMLRRRLEENIRIQLKEIGVNTMNWFD
jgi:hypothetical protein